MKIILIRSDHDFSHQSDYRTVAEPDGDRRRSIEADISQGSTGVEAKRRAPAIVDGVDAMVKRFMTIRDFGGRITPMDLTLTLRTSVGSGVQSSSISSRSAGLKRS